MEWLTLGEIAKSHNINYHTLFYRLKRGDIPYTRAGVKTILIHRDDVVKLLQPRRETCSS
jgi:excisionase family DNA binding protein